MGWIFGKTLVVLISGKAGTGKDLVGELLNKFLYNKSKEYIIKTGFAIGVKRAAVLCFGWKGKKDKKGRKLLQQIGNAGREYNPVIWPETMMDLWMGSSGSILPAVLIITDWRFPNELEYFENQSDIYNILKIRVESPERESLKGTEAYDDISEISLPGGYEMPEFYDYIINNTGTKEELEKVCETLADEILKGEN